MVLSLMGRNKVTFDFSTTLACTSGEHWVVVHLWDICSPSLKYMEEEEEGAWRCTGGSNWKALGGCRLGMCRLKGKKKCCYIILAQRNCSFIGFWCNFLYIHLLEENFQERHLPSGLGKGNGNQWGRAGGGEMEKWTHILGDKRRKRALGDGFLHISLGKTQSTPLLRMQQASVNLCWKGETGLCLEIACGSFLRSGMWL